MKNQAKEKTKENLNGESQNTTSKIDAIKELIFGENIQAYNSEFEGVKADILAKKEELQNLISTVESELLQNIDTLSTDINIRITDLENSVNDKLDNLDNKKVNRKLLSELFIKLGEKISD
ncbi:fructose 1,6-bisphosphatase [uncultured Algibacter sp.]|uniref:fructose 1,6-bisphosphatase n=1 Tax=uncultured Algibacter sp. TaxID=298659 RepID=UPI0030EBC17E|tara:strand:+ start:1485 stop:1847 length:363 start_codon:yes stop_codon:yes gene_type:complete